MCFPRKPSLGRYSASREEWAQAYQQARIAAGKGHEPDASCDGVVWKAMLIVAHDRAMPDQLSIPVENRLELKRLIDSLID